MFHMNMFVCRVGFLPLSTVRQHTNIRFSLFGTLLLLTTNYNSTTVKYNTNSTNKITTLTVLTALTVLTVLIK